VLAKPIVKVLSDTSLFSAEDLEDFLLQSTPFGDVAVGFKNDGSSAPSGDKLKARRYNHRPASLGHAIKLSFP
jgi:hypothetical protein